MRIFADKFRSPKLCYGLLFGGCSCCCSGVAAFLSTLHRAAPKVTESVVAGTQRVVAVALGKGETAVIPYALHDCVNATFRIVRWPFCGAVEEHIKLDFQPPNVFFEAR